MNIAQISMNDNTQVNFQIRPRIKRKAAERVLLPALSVPGGIVAAKAADVFETSNENDTISQEISEAMNAYQSNSPKKSKHHKSSNLHYGASDFNI